MLVKVVTEVSLNKDLCWPISRLVKWASLIWFLFPQQQNTYPTHNLNYLRIAVAHEHICILFCEKNCSCRQGTYVQKLQFKVNSARSLSFDLTSLIHRVLSISPILNVNISLSIFVRSRWYKHNPLSRHKWFALHYQHHKSNLKYIDDRRKQSESL